jgi:hypothetical protein
MSTQVISEARAFVQQAVLPAARPETLAEPGPGTQSPFDAVKQQAVVVGSDVVSFIKEITPEQRKDIVNAALLAQLVANKKVRDPQSLDTVLAWYKEYFGVLSQIGFVVQESGFAEYTEKSDSFEAHEAILDVVKVVLAGAPAALTIVTKTLESLKKLNADTPWITLFHRESRSANTARFQVSLADADTNGSFLSLMAFGITAKAEIKQVLFFRFKKNESRLHHDSAKLSINGPVLEGLRDDIAKKITKFTSDFVAGLEI